MFLLASTLILCTFAEALQVIGGDQTAVQNGTVILPCKLVDSTEKLTQISWQRRTRGKPQNENFYTILSINGPKFVNGHDDRFKFVGNISDNIGSLQLSNVTLMDEGTYTCIFTLFPSGNVKTEMLLNLLVPPISSLEDHHPILGNAEVSLVTCTAASSKPPAEVTWLFGTLQVRAITTSFKHENGTTTTVSSLLGVPTKEIYNQLVRCVVSSMALSKEEILTFPMQVYSVSPMEVNIREVAKGKFECETEANPKADFAWSRSDDTWPQSAVRVGASLEFQEMVSNLDGLYQCEASNNHGQKRGHLYLHVSSEACTTCWILFSISLAVLAVGAAVYLYKSGRFRRTSENTNQEMLKVPKHHEATEDEGGEEVEEEECIQPLHASSS